MIGRSSGTASCIRREIFPLAGGSGGCKTRFDHNSAASWRVDFDRSAHEPDPVTHAGEAHPRFGLAVEPAAIIRHAQDEPRKRRIAQIGRLDRRFELERRLDTSCAGVAKCVGQRLLHEAIGHQTRALAQGFDAPVYVERDHNLGSGAAPMRHKRLQRLDKPELLERGGPEIGQNAPVLALQLSDLRLDCARRLDRKSVV